jgi:phosphoglycerate kinase
MPSVAGLLLEKEVDNHADYAGPGTTLLAIIGGAKISDKIDVLNKFIEIADFIAVGGAMANTFLAAKELTSRGANTNRTTCPSQRYPDRSPRGSQKRTLYFYVPQDGVVAKLVDKTARTRIVDWDAACYRRSGKLPQQPSEKSRTIGDDEMILDIGPFSGAFIAGGIQLANTVSMERHHGRDGNARAARRDRPVLASTELIVDAMLGDYGHRPFSFVGGGDTVGYVEGRKLTGAFNHVSTGGGASLS